MGGRGGSSGGSGSGSGGYHPNNIVIIDGEAGEPLDYDDDPTIPDATRQRMVNRLRRQERIQKYEPIEHLTLTDRTGKVILHVEGDEGSVRVTPEQRQLIYEHGHTVTHNHPGAGGPLSWADFRSAVNFNTGMRATDFQHTYEFRPGRAGWDSVKNKEVQTDSFMSDGKQVQVHHHPPIPFMTWAEQKLNGSINRAFDRIREVKEQNKLSRSPGQTVREGNYLVKRYLDKEIHTTWQEIAHKGGFQYSRQTTRDHGRLSGRNIRRR